MPNAKGWYQFAGPIDAAVLADRFPGLAEGASVEGDRVRIAHERKDYLSLIEEVDDLRGDAIAGSVAIEDAFGLVVRLPPRWVPPRFDVEEVPERARIRAGLLEGTVGAPIVDVAWSADGSLLATAHQFQGLAVVTVWEVAEEGLRRKHELPVGERFVPMRSIGFAARALLAWTEDAGSVGALRLVSADEGHVLRTKTFDKPIKCAASAPDGFGLAVILEGERQITLLDASLEPHDVRAVHADYDDMVFGPRGRLVARGPEGLDAMDLKLATDLGRFVGGYTAGVPLDDGIVAARTEGGRVLLLSPGSEPDEIIALGGVRAIAGAGTRLVAWGDGEIIDYDVAQRLVTARRPVATTQPVHVAVALSADAVAWSDGTRVVLPESPEAPPSFDGLVAGGARAVRRSDDEVVVLDPLDESVPPFRLDPDVWFAPTVDGSVVVVAEAVDGGKPTERGLTRVTFRTAEETLGCTYLSDARTADLTPDARHLVVEIDGAFSVVTAVGGEFRAAVGPAVDQLSFAIVAPVGLQRTREGLRIADLTASPGPPVDLDEPDVELGVLAEDGSFSVSAGARLARWDRADGQLRWARGDWSADHVAVSPDGRQIVLTVGGGIHWFSAADGRHIDSRAGHPHGVRQVAFRADGTLLTLGLEGTIVQWKARGELRPIGSDAAEILRAAFLAHDQSLRAPWLPQERTEPPAPVAALPAIVAEVSPPDPTAGVRIHGTLEYYGESPLNDATLAYHSATEREAGTDLTVEGRQITVDVTLAREDDVEPLHRGILELSRRALGGAVEIHDPRRIHHFTFEAGIQEPPTPRYGVVPGARARLSRLRAPHWERRPQVEERGGWLWWLGAYHPDGERTGPVAPVQRLRVIDQATGQQIWSQLLFFEGVLSVAPDGRLALLTAEDPVEALEEQVGLKLLDPSDNLVTELVEGAFQFTRQVSWAPDGRTFGFVSEGDDTRVEVWDRSGVPRFNLPLRAWAFSESALICAGSGELAFIDVDTGNVTRTLPWPRRDHQLLALGEGFVAIGDEGIAIVDGEGAIERSLPNLWLDEGSVLADDDGEPVLIGPRGERVRLSDGQPLSAPGYVEAAAIRGPRVATWHGEELLVRGWATGEVRIRERVAADSRWVGQPSLTWASNGDADSLILAVDDHVRCLDPDGTWRISGRVGLVAVAPAPSGQVQTAHLDGLVRLYDVATGTVAVESRLPFPIEAFAGHRDATHAVVRTGSVVRHVVLETGEVLDEVTGVPVGARIALSPNGRSFAIALPDNVLVGGGGFDQRTVDVRARSLVFLLDGQHLALGGDDDLIYVVRSSTGEIEGRLVGHHGYVAVLDTDGATLISAAVDGLVWSLEGLELMGFGHNAFLD